jgi:hypothetical protein
MVFKSDGNRTVSGPSTRKRLPRKPVVSGKVEYIRTPGPESMPKARAEVSVAAKPKQAKPPGNFSAPSVKAKSDSVSRPSGPKSRPAQPPVQPSTRTTVYKEEPAQTSKRVMTSAYDRMLKNSQDKGASSVAVDNYLKRKKR